MICFAAIIVVMIAFFLILLFSSINVSGVPARTSALTSTSSPSLEL